MRLVEDDKILLAKHRGFYVAEIRWCWYGAP